MAVLDKNKLTTYLSSVSVSGNGTGKRSCMHRQNHGEIKRRGR
jgi:hypothetical protein